MGIKTATIKNAEDIHRIHDEAVKETCKNFYTQEQIHVWLADRSPEKYHKKINSGQMYVAQTNNKVVGYGHAIPGEIVAVFVDLTFQGRGIGKQLLDYGLKIALQGHHKVTVESTLNAEAFYKKHGFIKVRDDIHIKKDVEAPVIILEYSATSPNNN
jgi:N-acetylglutamate synthase-like GNAT family acetyltransferase